VLRKLIGYACLLVLLISLLALLGTLIPE